MDSAKAIGLGALYDGDVWDFFEHKTPITQMLPLGVISTIPATGSEASDTSVMTNDDGQIKRHIADIILRPSFAILNPELTYTLPRRIFGWRSLGSEWSVRYRKNRGLGKAYDGS